MSEATRSVIFWCLKGTRSGVVSGVRSKKDESKKEGEVVRAGNKRRLLQENGEKRTKKKPSTIARTRNLLQIK